MLRLLNKDQSGFTILDAIISMLLITIMVMGTTTILVVSLRIQSKSLEQTKAQEVAADQLKQIKTLDWTQVMLDETYYNDSANASALSRWDDFKLAGAPLTDTSGVIKFHQKSAATKNYDVYITVTCETTDSDCMIGAEELPRVVRVVVNKSNLGKAPEGIYSLSTTIFEGQNA